MRIRFGLLVTSAALLGACSYLEPATNTAQQGNPIVRGTDRGQAMLTVIACPINTSGGALLTEYLQSLATAAPIVTAADRSSARLVINMCASPPDAEMLRAVGASTGTSTRRR